MQCPLRRTKAERTYAAFAQHNLLMCVFVRVCVCILCKRPLSVWKFMSVWMWISLEKMRSDVLCMLRVRPNMCVSNWFSVKVYRYFARVRRWTQSFCRGLFHSTILYNVVCYMCTVVPFVQVNRLEMVALCCLGEFESIPPSEYCSPLA